MKFVLGCTILSDGSLILVSYPTSNFLGSYKYLTRDVNNNPYWSGSNPEYQTEVAAFISRLEPPVNKP